MTHRISPRKLAWLGLAFLACACQAEAPKLTPAAGTSRPDYAPPGQALHQFGSLAALAEGGIGPTVWLSTLKGGSSLVGLGSLSELRGEVLIVDGTTWLGYPTGPRGSYARKLGPSDETAAFLVTATVPAWRRMSLSREVRFEALEESVAQLGRDAGLDAKEPFPIIVEGTLQKLEFNVVNGRGFEAGRPIPRAVLMAAATRAAVDSTQGTLVGFYGPEAQGEFVHPDTRLHVHVLLPEEQQVGHVERVDLPAGVIVRVPAPGD
jgi:alpha-acetolactate decarboxylase